MKKHLKIFSNVVRFSVAFFIGGNAGFLIIALLLYFLGVRNFSQTTGEFISDIAVLPFIIILFKLYTTEKRKELFEKSLTLKRLFFLIPISFGARALLFISIILLLALALVFTGVDINKLIEEGLKYQWEAFDTSVGIVQIFGFLSFVIFGPINEELFSRGVLFNYLKKHYSVRTSIIYSSIIFMFLHIHPGLYLSSFLLGIILAYIYSRWKNIWYSIILHMLINLHPFIITYFFGR